MTRDIRSLLLPGIVVVVAFGTIVTGVLTPRDVSMGEDDAIMTVNGDLVAFSLSRIFTATVLFVSVAAITVTVIRRGFPRAGLSLWLAYATFVVSNFFLPGLAGRVPGLDVRLLLPPVAFTAIYFARPVPLDRVVTLCKVVLGVFIYASLIAAVLVPAQALAADYSGFIPAVAVRLYGVGGGATSLGPQAAAYLAIETVWPARSRMRVMHLLAAATVLLLAQSKTAWAFVVLGVFWLVSRRFVRWLSSPSTRGGRMGRRWKAVYLSAFFLGCIALLAQLLSRAMSKFLESSSNIQTLTGRTHVWVTSIRVWLDNPVFGYGNGLWEDESFRAAHGAFAHSHNQFIHSLGSAGIVGLVGLLVYLGAAWRAARRQTRTNAVPLVLYLLMLTVSLTEVPLRSHYLLDAFAVLHLLLFALLMEGEKAEEPAAAVPVLEAMPTG